MPTNPEKKLGDYTLDREIGRGSRSIVYEATDPRLKRKVAIKVLVVPPEMTGRRRKDLIERWQRAARLMGGVGHPSLLTIYGIREQGGTHFLVTEFLEGITLRERLARGPLAPAEAASILYPAADALDALHANQLPAGNLDPAQIMLLADGRVKLTEILEAPRNAPKSSDRNVAPTAVILSLAALLYEMLTGQPSAAAKNASTASSRATLLADASLPQVSPAALRFLRRAMDPEAAGKFTSARAFANAFRAAAVPRALWSRQGPWPWVSDKETALTRRRRRVSLAVTGLALLVVLIGAALLFRPAAPPRQIARTDLPPPARQAPPPVPPARPKPKPAAPRRAPAAAAPAREPARKPAPRVAQQEPSDNWRPPPLRPERSPAPAKRKRAVRAANRKPAMPAAGQQAAAVTRPPRPWVPKRRRAVAAVTEPRTTVRPSRPPQKLRKRAPARPIVVAKARTQPPLSPRAAAARRTRRRLQRTSVAANRAAAAAEPIIVWNVPPEMEPQTERSPRRGSVPPNASPRRQRPSRPSPDRRRAAPLSRRPDEMSLVGTWRGTHARRPATLVITRQTGYQFEGMLTVETNDGPVKLAITGDLFPDTGEITLWEKKVIQEPRKGFWRLGVNLGRLTHGTQMTGMGEDPQGRPYTWAFMR